MYPKVVIFDHSNEQKPVSIQVDVVSSTGTGAFDEPSIMVTSAYEHLNEDGEQVDHEDVGVQIEMCLNYDEAEVLILRLQQALHELIAESYKKNKGFPD